jgi:hypothetical protein
MRDGRGVLWLADPVRYTFPTDAAPEGSGMAEENGLRTYAFVLALRDLAASAAYFEDALGFVLDWKDADDWRLLSRGGVRMMLGHCPNEKPAAEIAARGAIIRQAPADKPWGLREMLIATPDGHRIMVGQTL